MSELDSLLNRVISQWRKKNIPIRPGVASETISEFESLNAVKLPPDMREFYSLVDGTGNHYDDEGFYRFWPFEEIQPIGHYLSNLSPSPTGLSDYFAFFDHSIDIDIFAIRLGPLESNSTPVQQIWPPTGELSERHFSSFTEFLSTYLNNPNDLL